MAENQTESVSDEMFDTLLSSLVTPVFSPNDPGASLHTLGLCELKIKILLQDYDNLRELSAPTDAIPSDIDDLKHAVQTMTLKNKAVNRRIIQLSSELAARQADSASSTADTTSRMRLQLHTGRRATTSHDGSLFTPEFRTSSMKLAEFGHLTSVERHLRELSGVW